MIQSLSTVIPRLLNTGTNIGLGRETFKTQANAITAIFQEALTQDWSFGATAWPGSRFLSESQYQYAQERLSSVVTTNLVILPLYVHAHDVNISQRLINFPVKRWTDDKVNRSDMVANQWSAGDKIYNFTILRHRNTTNLQTQWINLPVDRFGPVSGGLLLRFPRNTPNSSQLVVGCSISASWFSDEISSDSLSFQSAYLFPFPDYRDKQWTKVRKDLNASSGKANLNLRLITIREKWFQSLAPRTNCASHSAQSERLSTWECIFSDVG